MGVRVLSVAPPDLLEQFSFLFRLTTVRVVGSLTSPCFPRLDLALECRAWPDVEPLRRIEVLIHNFADAGRVFHHCEFVDAGAYDGPDLEGAYRALARFAADERYR